MDISEKYIRMCSFAQEIQHKWTDENGDYIYDTIDGDAGVWYWYQSKDVSDCIWLRRQDQLQELCIEFFIRIMDLSEYEAFIHLLGSYSSWLNDAHRMIWITGGGYKDVGSFEELMLLYTMEMLHSKSWDGEKWTNAFKGYEAKPSSNLSMNQHY
jgi:hypothetical protein